jgi:hypothetical protein
MKYQQPVGKAADAAYVDGNRSAGIKGDIPPAASIEHPQREIVHVITHVGRTPAADDLQQLRKSIDDMIDLKIGGAPESTYLTLAQAAARLPIHMEILTGDGKINVSSPGAGTILVPASVNFMHRGIAPYLTTYYDEETERTFATEAGKTYHLRWTPGDGFALKDLADAGYNPSVKEEGAIDFDGVFDDALIARIVTDGSNVAAITNLVNRPVLAAAGQDTFTAGALAYETGTLPASISNYVTKAINWSRRPDFAAMNGLNDVAVNRGTITNEFNAGVRVLGRYALAVWYQSREGGDGAYVGWNARG